jgi:predicted nucleic acid-binding protein
LIYILDACTFIALLKQEQGAEKIKALLDEAMTGQSVVYMNIINLIEVHYGFCRELGQKKSDLILEQIYAMPVRFIDNISTTVFSETSRLKAAYALSLADAIGIATAIELSGIFVTADHHELEVVANKEALNFPWFR